MNATRVRYQGMNISLAIDEIATPCSSASDWSGGGGGGGWYTLELLGGLALVLLKAIAFVVAIVGIVAWWTVSELACLTLAGIGLVGRGIDAAGRVGTSQLADHDGRGRSRSAAQHYPTP